MGPIRVAGGTEPEPGVELLGAHEAARGQGFKHHAALSVATDGGPRLRRYRRRQVPAEGIDPRSGNTVDHGFAAGSWEGSDSPRPGRIGMGATGRERLHAQAASMVRVAAATMVKLGGRVSKR